MYRQPIRERLARSPEVLPPERALRLGRELKLRNGGCGSWLLKCGLWASRAGLFRDGHVERMVKSGAGHTPMPR